MGLLQKISDAREMAAEAENDDGKKAKKGKKAKGKKGQQSDDVAVASADGEKSGLFGRKKKKSEPTPKAPEQKKQKKGLGGKMGVERVKAKDPDDEKRRKRHKIIDQVWIYLRKEFDLGVREYLGSGESNQLYQILTPELYQRLTTELDQMRDQGIIWSFPGRETLSNSRIKVVHEELNHKTGRPEKMQVAERYLDHSQVKRGSEEVSCPGTHRELQGTIVVVPSHDGVIYQITELTRIDSE